MPQLANLSTDFSIMSAEIFNTDDHNGAGRPAEAVKSLMDYFYSVRDSPNENVSAVLGPTFSSVAKPTALMASAEQVPMLSYFASSRELSNKSTYPFFTRTYPTDDTAAQLLTRVLYDGSVFEDWNHVAVVYRDDAFGQGYLDTMQEEFYNWTRSMPEVRSTSPLPNNFNTEDVEKYYTLRSFPFNDKKPESINGTLERVRDSSCSIIVLIGASQSLAYLLEASLAVFVLRVAPPAASSLLPLAPLARPFASVHPHKIRFFMCGRWRINSAWLRQSMRGSSWRALLHGNLSRRMRRRASLFRTTHLSSTEL